MKNAHARVTHNLELSSTCHLIFVRCPEIATQAKAGQFVHVRRPVDSSDPLLRRPLSICLPGSSKGSREVDELALLIEIVGRGTAGLAALNTGEELDLLGPLGHGFALDAKSRQVLLIAGGVGIAPLLTLATEALRREVAVTLLFGARNAAKVFPASFVPAEVEYRVFTEDGSAGQKGLVTTAVGELLSWADQVFACGPEGMLRSTAALLRNRRPTTKPNSPAFAQICMEQRMGCGVGACYGCAIETSSGRKRVCRDGPVFDLSEVDL